MVRHGLRDDVVVFDDQDLRHTEPDYGERRARGGTRAAAARGKLGDRARRRRRRSPDCSEPPRARDPGRARARPDCSGAAPPERAVASAARSGRGRRYARSPPLPARARRAGRLRGAPRRIHGSGLARAQDAAREAARAARDRGAALRERRRAARAGQGRGREHPRADRRRAVPERAGDRPCGRLASVDSRGAGRTPGDGRARRAGLAGRSDAEESSWTTRRRSRSGRGCCAS